MNQLAEINDLDTHMKSVFRNSDSNVIFYPYIKFKDKTIIITTKNSEGKSEEKELDKLKVRFIYKTNCYQLTSGEGGDFKVLGQSNEFIDRSAFMWFDFESKSFKKNLKTSADVKAIIGELRPGMKLDYKTVIYFHVEGYGIVKSYLKRTQTCGMVHDKAGYRYTFDTPLANGYDHFTKGFKEKLYDYLVNVAVKSYKLGTLAVITYPVFSDPEEFVNPEVLAWVKEIFQNILNDTQYRLNQCDSEMEAQLSPTVIEAQEADATWMDKKETTDLPF